MSRDEIMSFLNHNHTVHTGEYHFVDFKDDSKIFGYFNAFSNDTFSNQWSYTRVLDAGEKQVIMIDGNDIARIQNLKTSP
jgi:hypothetical protein